MIMMIAINRYSKIISTSMIAVAIYTHSETVPVILPTFANVHALVFGHCSIMGAAVFLAKMARMMPGIIPPIA